MFTKPTSFHCVLMDHGYCMPQFMDTVCCSSRKLYAAVHGYCMPQLMDTACPSSWILYAAVDGSILYAAVQGYCMP